MKNYIEKTEIIDGVEYITNFDEHASYVCIPTESIDYWVKKLSNTEFGVAYGLARFISHGDNSLKLKQRFLSAKDIAIELDMDYGVIRRIISQLLKQNALCRYYINVYENKYIKAYILNPSIAYRDGELNDETINIFKDKRLIEINNALFSNSSDRHSPEYKNWVFNCLERDNYTCQCCGSNNNLEVHHLLNYSKHKDLRTDVDNGITLCECCHSPMISGSFHQIYGTRDNTKQQLEEYIKNHK